MLEIYIDNTKVDIFEDTSITLTLSNPMFDEQGIPTPYSLSFSLPKSRRNLAVIDHSHRPTSQWERVELRAVILFNSIEISRGKISIDAISKDDIDVSFNSADFLATTSKWLYEQDLGRISFGKATFVDGSVGRPNEKYWNMFEPFTAYKQYWDDRILDEFPVIAAPTMAIKDFIFEAHEDIPGRPPGQTSYYNQRVGRINNYTALGYGTSRQTFAKILPSIQLSYILSKIHPNFGQLFSDSELRRIMIVSTYHPSYQAAKNEQVWSLDTTTGDVYLDIADFMPKVNTGDFLCECLKLLCASIFIVKGSPVVALKQDILQSDRVLDWSEKVIGTPSIAFSPAQKYIVEYADQSTDEPLPPERVIETINDISAMITASAPDSNLDTMSLRTYQIKSTGQTFEQTVSSFLSSDSFAHFDYKLIQDMPTLIKQEDDVSDSYSVSLGITPVRMVVCDNMLSDGAMVPAFSPNTNISQHNYIYCPQVETSKDNQRPDKVIVGSYFGKKRSLGFGTHFEYPFMTSDNCDAFGSRTPANISLELGGDRGIIKQYHKEFALWIEKEKRTLTCQMLLDVLDLHNLDLRNKVHVNGRNYLIKEISITLHPRSIAPIDIELIEL